MSDVRCDLCAGPADERDRNEVADMIVCPECLEAMLYAPAYEPRAEVGMVGSGGGRS